MSTSVPISIGELWGKYSILLIKKEKIKNENKLNYIETEINYLYKLMSNYSYNENNFFLNLKNINKKL